MARPLPALRTSGAVALRHIPVPEGDVTHPAFTPCGPRPSACDGRSKAIPGLRGLCSCTSLGGGSRGPFAKRWCSPPHGEPNTEDSRSQDRRVAERTASPHPAQDVRPVPEANALSAMGAGSRNEQCCLGRRHAAVSEEALPREPAATVCGRSLGPTAEAYKATVVCRGPVTALRGPSRAASPFGRDSFVRLCARDLCAWTASTVRRVAGHCFATRRERAGDFGQKSPVSGWSLRRLPAPAKRLKKLPAVGQAPTKWLLKPHRRTGL